MSIAVYIEEASLMDTGFGERERYRERERTATCRLHSQHNGK
jgi:hypothetical protein